MNGCRGAAEVRRAGVAGAIIALGIPGVAAAETPPRPADPDLTITAEETLDNWRNLDGGAKVGGATLNKLQVSATWTANDLGAPDFRAHVQIFRTDGAPLTSRVGDIQTVSNIEAPSTYRLFETWVEKSFGGSGAGGAALRVGLIDLNSSFNSIEPASLFINSSNGIGPDLSRSGRNGPSNFPVTAMAARLIWMPADRWTVQAGLFDGVPGDPERPKAFAVVRLGARDGALAIAEVDRRFGEDGQVSVGVWRYSRAAPRLAGEGQGQAGGAFVFVEGPVPVLDAWRGWIRVGHADPEVQVVSGFLGAGLVRKGVFAARPNDRLGFAVSHAMISPDARRVSDLHEAETTWEATYQIKTNNGIAVQPDVQYVVHPSGQAGVRNALVVGLRIVVTAGYPKTTSDADPVEASVTPDIAAVERPA